MNGKSYDAGRVGAVIFASPDRTWKNHDTVEERLPFGFRTQAIDDRNPDIAALMQGPRMMAAVGAPDGILELESAGLASRDRGVQYIRLYTSEGPGSHPVQTLLRSSR